MGQQLVKEVINSRVVKIDKLACKLYKIEFWLESAHWLVNGLSLGEKTVICTFEG